MKAPRGQGTKKHHLRISKKKQDNPRPRLPGACGGKNGQPLCLVCAHGPLFLWESCGSGASPISKSPPGWGNCPACCPTGPPFFFKTRIGITVVAHLRGSLPWPFFSHPDRWVTLPSDRAGHMSNHWFLLCTLMHFVPKQRCCQRSFAAIICLVPFPAAHWVSSPQGPRLGQQVLRV